LLLTITVLDEDDRPVCYSCFLLSVANDRDLAHLEPADQDLDHLMMFRFVLAAGERLVEQHMTNAGTDYLTPHNMASVRYVLYRKCARRVGYRNTERVKLFECLYKLIEMYFGPSRVGFGPKD
jgi:hypothetical protein